jgi:predicted dinucleotide-binding enzyme
MTIGIIGSGAIGTAFARTLSRAGIEATISNSRGPDSLKDLVRELGPSIKAGTREQAARADIVFVAVNWTKLRAAMEPAKNQAPAWIINRCVSTLGSSCGPACWRWVRRSGCSRSTETRPSSLSSPSD